MSAKSKSRKGKDGVRDTSPEPTPGTSHRSKKRRLSTDDEDDSGSPKRPTAHSTSKLGHNGLRSPSFTPHNKPAELFRKDLISAMKLADSEPLQQDYIFIADPWRQEWEKGVQVPVNPGEIPNIQVKELCSRPATGDFKIPRKYLHATQDETYRQGIHELTGMHQLSEQVVRYDLDDLDVMWLETANEQREELGLVPIHEWTMERVIEALESNCHERIKNIMKTEEGLGIEYDEDIVCEVCRSPDSEETNEMVFCDGCDICVHQACYGIQKIPEGRWLCRTCSLGIKPTCILCPKMGGAMKSTKSGTKWAHVSCALWIPEVSIGCVEKMEPITKISNIPASRWALVCCVCKDRVGACIQCSVKTCKTAFHVTCAIFNGLEMKTILDETDDGDGVKLKAFCPRHSKKREHSQSDSEADSPRKDAPSTPRKDLSKEEVANLRAKRLTELKNSFHDHIDCHEVSQQLSVEEEVVEIVMAFWTLKRKTSFDKPLLMPKTEEADMLEKQQEDSLVARMKMFVHLRQDLERVRNLCYMISRREKTKRQYYKIRENAFMAAVRALTDVNVKLSSREAEKLAKKYTANSLYEGYDSEIKPRVVNRLSFSTSGLMPSPQVTDDTESVDSDCRDSSVPFRERLYSQDSDSKLEKDADTFVAVAYSEELSNLGKDSESDLNSGKEDIRKDENRKRRRHRMSENVEKHAEEIMEKNGKDRSLKCEKSDQAVNVEIKKDVETKQAVNVETKHAVETIQAVETKQTVNDETKQAVNVETEHVVKVVTKHAVDVETKHSVDVESNYMSVNSELPKADKKFPAKLLKKVGRPKSHKRKREKHHLKTKVVDSSESSDKSVKENHDKSGVVEKIYENSDKNVKEVCGKETEAEKVNLEIDSNSNCSFDIAVSPGRGRGRGRDRVKVEPDLESEIVDVVDIEPQIGCPAFHPNIDAKIESAISEKPKVEGADERPKRLLRENRQPIEMPKVDVSPTRHSSPEAIKVEEVVHPVKESKKERHRRHGHRRHKRQHRSSERRRERTLSRERKLSDSVKLEVNGVIRKSSKYVVENSVKERVQNKLLKSRKLRYMNGALDKSQCKIDTFFKKTDSELSLRQSSRILNEISPDKGKVPFENNLFGAHYTPKGSLSGYKIPKKGDSTERTPSKSQSCEKVEKSDRSRRKGDNCVKRDIFSETGFDSLNTDSDFSKDVELVTDSRGYRSHSPLSSAGTDVSDHARPSQSREGTPRRVTRSQLVDVDENSMNSVDSVSTRSNMKLRLSDGWLKPSKFSS